MSKQINIDRLSLVPLFLELLLESYANQGSLGSGTGFVIQKENQAYLVTNWHVLSGRDPATDNLLYSTGFIPDMVGIWHHVQGKLGTWRRRLVSLKKPDGSPAWLELRQGGRIVDVAALPLSVDTEVQLYPLDLGLAKTALILSPSELVSIVGFPFGLSTGGGFPIWKTGHIASDIDIDYDGLPVFLIDATTKPGMSGSPVIARRILMHQTAGTITSIGGEAIRFLGVHSGGLFRGEADVGMVWKPEVINSLIK